MNEPQGHEKNTVESITAEYAFIGEEHKARLEEGFKLKKMLMEIDKKVEEGSQWYLLPKGWLKKWERYCFLDIIMSEPGSEEALNADGADRDPPGSISYADIIENDRGEEQLKEVSMKHRWHNHQLRDKLCEGKHFMLVNLKIIEFLHEKYSIA